MNQDSREYKNYIDKGWSSMEFILDREMPQKKKRRIAFWWFGVGFMVLLGTSLYAYFQMNESGPMKNSISIDDQSLMEHLNSEGQAQVTAIDLNSQTIAESANTQDETDAPLVESSASNSNSKPTTPRQFSNANSNTNTPKSKSKIIPNAHVLNSEPFENTQNKEISKSTELSTKDASLARDNISLQKTNTITLLANSKERKPEHKAILIEDNSNASERPQTEGQEPYTISKENRNSPSMDNDNNPNQTLIHTAEPHHPTLHTKEEAEYFQFPFVEVLKWKNIQLDFAPLPLIVELDTQSEDDPVSIEQSKGSKIYLQLNLDKNTRNAMYGFSPSLGISFPLSEKVDLALENEWSYVTHKTNIESMILTRVEKLPSISNIKRLYSTSLEAVLAYHISSKWKISAGVGLQYPISARFNDINDFGGAINMDPDISPSMEEDIAGSPLDPSSTPPSDQNFSLDRKLLPYSSIQFGYNISEKWNINLTYDHHFKELYPTISEPINLSKIQLGLRMYLKRK